MYDGEVDTPPEPEIVVVGDAPSVRSPLSGETGAFVILELWAGEEPGGVRRRVAALVLGDVVELLPALGGPPRTVLVRRARVLTRGVPRLVPLAPEVAHAPELVTLLASSTARAGDALALGERLYRRGDRFRATAPTAGEPLVLEELERNALAPRHEG